MNIVRTGSPAGRTHLNPEVLGDRVVFPVAGWDSATPGLVQVSGGAWPTALVVSVELSDDGGATFLAPAGGAVTFTAVAAKAAIDVKSKTHVAFRVSTVGGAGLMLPILRGITEA